MKKKVGIIIGVVAVVIIVAILLVVQFVFNKATDELKQEEELLNKLSIETKSGETVELAYSNFENGEFYLKFPKTFKQMDEETIKVKYPNGNPPSFAFANDNATISIAVSISDVEMKDEAIGAFVESMKTQLGSGAEILDSSVTEKDGHTIGQLKMVTKGTDTEIYNHMLMFSCNDKFRTIGFNCTKELQEEWQEVGAFIINSLMFPVDEK